MFAEGSGDTDYDTGAASLDWDCSPSPSPSEPKAGKCDKQMETDSDPIAEELY